VGKAEAIVKTSTFSVCTFFNRTPVGPIPSWLCATTQLGSAVEGVPAAGRSVTVAGVGRAGCLWGRAGAAGCLACCPGFIASRQCSATSEMVNNSPQMNHPMSGICLVACRNAPSPGSIRKLPSPNSMNAVVASTNASAMLSNQPNRLGPEYQIPSPSSTKDRTTKWRAMLIPQAISFAIPRNSGGVL